MDEHFDDRRRMVDEQMRGRDIRTAPRVLDAMLRVPRHCCVPEPERHLAYDDAPLPIGHRQTISQPYIVALMSQLLELSGDETVLEIGTGSGYQTAVLACLASQVYTIERVPALAASARNAGAARIRQCESSPGGRYARPARARPLPCDRGHRRLAGRSGSTQAPGAWLRAELVLPVGGRGGQMLERWRRSGNRLDREQIAPVAFVPLIGEHGWSSEN